MDQRQARRSSARMIRHNRAVFDRLTGLAERRAAEGRDRSAVEWARAAASFAATNATGRLRSAGLESVADRVAARALAPSGERTVSETRRVVHVVSEARAIGGLSRLVERWIQRDSTSRSSVVVTLQDEVIAPLRAAAEASGGGAVAFGLGDVVTQAAELRALGDSADVVVCHVHPGDPVPAIAFGAGYRGAPVAYFNHSDHLFWWAPTHATYVVEFREAGRSLTVNGRGYEPAATYELPLLVPAAGQDGSPVDLRRSLGFGADAVVAVTVARESKFQDTSIEPTFSQILSAALDRTPTLAFCAVGPTPDDSPWPSLLRRYPGRVRVTGPVRDPRPYLHAADVYLDTYPFSSLTSMLEASEAGLPVLMYDGHTGFRRTLGIADFAPTAADRPTTLEAYVQRLHALATDPEARRLSGRQARDTYLALAPEGRWHQRMLDLYAALERRAQQGGRIGDSVPPPDDVRLEDYAEAIYAVEQRVPLLWMFGGGMPLFDDRDRAVMRPRVLTGRVLSKLAGRTPAGRRLTEQLLLGAAPTAATASTHGLPVTR